jgi:catalase
MGFSPDKMLQARIFAYPDAQRYRIGSNYQQLPVNKPRCPFHHYQRGGAMNSDNNSQVNYEPNQFNGPVEDPAYRDAPRAVSGMVDRHNHRDGNDDYQQAGDLFRLMTAAQQQHLVENIVGSLSQAPRDIQLAQVKHFLLADSQYGMAIAKGLKLEGAL